MSNTSNKYYVGVDVSKANLDFFFPHTQQHIQLSNTKSGISKAIKLLPKNKRFCWVLEATGGYERTAVCTLQHAGQSVSIINPRRLRDFARSQGYLAKTDKIDARVISKYAQVTTPKEAATLTDDKAELLALEKRSRQLTEQIKQEKQRLEKAEPYVHTEIKRHIAYLNKSQKTLEQKIAKLIERTPQIQARYELMMTVPGVGKKIALSLLALLPELGQINHKSVSALVGVAPYNCDSGRKRGKRKVYGGRQAIRNMLHMAILTGIRFNPVISEFYNRLIGKGKAKMVAITACIHKLLCLLNAMVRDNQAWAPRIKS